MIVVDPLAAAIHPFRLTVLFQPIRSDHGQAVQDMTQSLADTLQTVESANGTQHMRGIRPLSATRCQPFSVPAFLEQSMKDLFLSPARHQTGTELTEHRAVETSVSQFQTEQILPVDPAADGIGSLTVREVFSILQQAHQQQPPGSLGRLPTGGKQEGKVLIGKQGSQFVAEMKIGITAWKSRTSD